jgi:preprotein translocase subunit SecY
MFEILAKILNTKELRGKILVTCLIVAIYRLGIFIPIPGIDVKAVDDLIAQTQSGGEGAGRVMAAINMFSGGALSKGAIFALGIMPYITASIVFQLLVAIVPSLARLQNEGATGRKKITQYTRLATLGLALLQSLFICGTLWSQSQGGSGIRLVSAGVAWYEFYFYGVLSLTTGTMFLMWLGEQVDEFGIGNGISIIILANCQPNAWCHSHGRQSVWHGIHAALDVVCDPRVVRSDDLGRGDDHAGYAARSDPAVQGDTRAKSLWRGASASATKGEPGWGHPDYLCPILDVPPDDDF